MNKVYLAYDASVNGDWVAHYAMHLAGLTECRELELVHVLAEKNPESDLSEKINRIEKLATQADLKFSSRILPTKKNILNTLLATIPAGAANLIVCGTRTRSGRQRGYLSGTISEKLLREKGRRVLALRVVQPGILGAPESILWPVSDNRDKDEALVRFITEISDQLREIHLFHVSTIFSFFFQYITARKAAQLKRNGREFIKSVAKNLQTGLKNENTKIDSNVVISDDWAKEILIYASKTKARLLVLGVAKRRLLGLFRYGNIYEHILRETPCDVAIYSGENI